MNFDINNPIRGGVGTINNLIGSYASPEAAQADLETNAPEGINYLRNQYQGLTGDAFADPFVDAGRVRSSAMTQAALQGASIATGGRSGGELLAPPRPMIAMNAAASPINMTTYGGSTGPQVATPQHNPLDHPELQLPDTTDSNFRKVQQMRVSQVGGNASALFQDYAHNKPSLLTPPVGHDQSLEFDDKGRPIAGDVLHKDLFNDPKFKSFLKTQPNEARGFYESITGRDFNADLQMQVAHEQSVTKTQQGILAEFRKTGDFDPITGEPFKTKQVADPLNPGEYKTVPIPLSYEEKAVLAKKGALEGQTGIPRPAAFDVSSAGTNVTPDEASKLRSKMIELRKQFPDDSIERLLQRARGAIAGTVGSPSKLHTANLAVANLGRTMLNEGLVDSVNRLLSQGSTGEGPIPKLPSIDPTKTVADRATDFWASLRNIGKDVESYASTY